MVYGNKYQNILNILFTGDIDVGEIIPNDLVYFNDEDNRPNYKNIFHLPKLIQKQNYY